MWWYTTIDVTFSHELATGRYEFRAVNVMHAGLKYDPGNKERERETSHGVAALRFGEDPLHWQKWDFRSWKLFGPCAMSELSP